MYHQSRIMITIRSHAFCKTGLSIKLSNKLIHLSHEARVFACILNGRLADLIVWNYKTSILSIIYQMLPLILLNVTYIPSSACLCCLIPHKVYFVYTCTMATDLPPIQLRNLASVQLLLVEKVSPRTPSPHFPTKIS